MRSGSPSLKQFPGFGTARCCGLKYVQLRGLIAASRATANAPDYKAFLNCPNLKTSGRILAEGDEQLLQALQEGGFCDGLLVTRDNETAAAADRMAQASILGNDKKIRAWKGQLSSVPAYQGPFDGAILASGLEDREELHEKLLSASFILKPGGTICLARPSFLNKENSANLRKLIWNLPLNMVGEDSHHYILEGPQELCLKVPPGYSFSGAPIEVEEEVVTGFGRGSKQMGTPTANLKPDALFAGPLHDLPLGVYFGWAQLKGAEGPHNGLYKTVLNIGKRPSIEDGELRTVELHVMHDFPSDFYGQHLRAILLGFIRPEIRFPGLPELIRRINMDKGIAKSQLDLAMYQKYLTELST